ncbi:(2Fe-2S)-binding protein [Nitrosomonas sp. Nm58]|jgi:bacterioferritin-associated ferredoxin|uniref:(2Fe-2S)-binding protein n=1 Tax=Nitrosomonas sp. Nm58 TaxID=200126 RepID=UPI000896E31B|nr:(2Fe-2S)-binding protein [Nitrosomonas sp. Nm58]SDY28252.1 bacterioferritin-associated ferredoxin [Nitrosomonas sp. Nm58]
MYICVCKGVTDHAIRQAVLQGAERMRDLKACLGVTEQCGLCACHTKMVLDQTRKQKTLAQPPSPEPTRPHESII